MALCGGNPDKPLSLRRQVRVASNGKEYVLVVDAGWNFNLLGDCFFERLWQTAARGVLSVVLMSPPCCTWTASREQPSLPGVPDGKGARALRGTDGDLVCPGLRAHEQLQVRDGNGIAERCIAVFDLMSNVGRNCIYVLPLGRVCLPILRCPSWST